MPYQSYVTSPRFVFIFCVVGACLLWLYMWQQHNKAFDSIVHQASFESSGTAHALSDNLSLHFQTVKQILQRTSERYHFNNLFGGKLHNDINHNLTVWANELPHIDTLFIVNKQGKITHKATKADSTFPIIESSNTLDIIHIAQHLESPEQDITISAYTTQNDDAFVLMSKPLNQLDGSMGGLIIAAIDGHYFSELLRGMEGQENSDFVIFDHQANAVLSLYKEHPKHMLSKDVFLQHELHSNDTPTHTRTVNDALMLFSVRPITGLPMSLMTIRHEQDFLTNWYNNKQQSYFILLIFGLVSITAIAITYLMNQQIQRTKHSEQKALIASQSKTDFLARMSHELRTPLNAIMGFTDILKLKEPGPLTQKQQDMLNNIHMCSTHLLDFINDILDFSKNEATKTTLHESEVDTASLVNEALTMISARAGLKDIRLNNNAASNMPYLFADQKKIKQILINLVTNAVKFTPEHGSITVSTSIDNKDHFVIKVSDTGVGIAKDDIPKALEIFEQVHDDPNIEGTGLGLPLSKMFTELHQGTFTLESVPNEGTTITMTFPKERVTSYRKQHSAAA